LLLLEKKANPRYSCLCVIKWGLDDSWKEFGVSSMVVFDGDRNKDMTS
jgi:hypothetical protein